MPTDKESLQVQENIEKLTEVAILKNAWDFILTPSIVTQWLIDRIGLDAYLAKLGPFERWCWDQLEEMKQAREKATNALSS